MKTISKIFAGIILLATMYLVVTDGMIEHFNLSRGVQYAFNWGSIVILIPFSVIHLFNTKEERA